ncbi:hypothetical protein [Bifidobacterium aquikefiri]|uniref:hypothetical protein n=1 Tax=Bifidobacterium aquikefiri TaxID=1653207 RepID=UPI0039E7D96D
MTHKTPCPARGPHPPPSPPGVRLWVYQCEYCRTWHLTSRDPATTLPHYSIERSRKPHSRKRGYKPRW